MNPDQLIVQSSLLQIDGDMIVLPRAAVIDVVPLDQVEVPQAPIAPIWFAGWVRHGDERLPVLRFEVLNGGAVPASNRRGRVAIVDGAGFRLGLMVQGYPHLAPLNRVAIEALPLRPTDRPERVIARARIARHEALIPDLAALRDETAAIGLPREVVAAE